MISSWCWVNWAVLWNAHTERSLSWLKLKRINIYLHDIPLCRTNCMYGWFVLYVQISTFCMTRSMTLIWKLINFVDIAAEITPMSYIRQTPPVSCWLRLFYIFLLCDKSAWESVVTHTKGPFYSYGLTLTPAWINNHIHHNVWDDITYPSLANVKFGNKKVI